MLKTLDFHVLLANLGFLEMRPSKSLLFSLSIIKTL